MTTYTHKVIAYFPDSKKARVSYYPTRGDAMESANQMKIEGTTHIEIQMV